MSNKFIPSLLAGATLAAGGLVEAKPGEADHAKNLKHHVITPAVAKSVAESAKATIGEVDSKINPLDTPWGTTPDVLSIESTANQQAAVTTNTSAGQPTLSPVMPPTPPRVIIGSPPTIAPRPVMPPAPHPVIIGSPPHASIDAGETTPAIGGKNQGIA